MSIVQRITRGTVLVNMPVADMGSAKVFGFGEFFGGLANLGVAAINAPQQEAAIEAAERQAQEAARQADADRAARAAHQQQVLRLVGASVLTLAVVAVLIAIIR